MTNSFREVTAIQPDGPSRYTTNIPDGWQQGRGAFGGLVMGTLVRAMFDHADDESRTVRTVTAALCGPAQPGPADIEVEVLRRGRSLVFVRATLTQPEGVRATATATIGVSRPVASIEFGPMGGPADPNWEAVPTVLIGPPMAPVFAQNFEFRPTGALPFSQGAVPEVSGWIRPREPEPFDAALLIGLLDTWWPAHFTTAPAPHGVATISFSGQLLIDPTELDGNAPLFHRGRTQWLRDGFALELRELWRDGRLIATNQQTFVLFG